MKSAEFWNRAAAKYAKSPIRDEATYEEKLETTRRFFEAGCRVLEFGCGTGSTAIRHAPHVGSIVATDISSSMIAIAGEKADAEGIENIEFRCETLEDCTEPEGSFDVVMAHNILHLLERPSDAIEASYRLLKPGGVFVTSTACLGDGFPLWRVLLFLAQLVGKAPYVNVLTREALKSSFLRAGFVVELEWKRPGIAAFIILRKPVA